MMNDFGFDDDLMKKRFVSRTIYTMRTISHCNLQKMIYIEYQLGDKNFDKNIDDKETYLS